MREAYRTKVRPISGTDYHEVYHRARSVYQNIKAKTKRRPYVRSVYFKKSKIFLDYFWEHLHQKNWRDRLQRLKFYPIAIDLIKNSRYEPESKQNPNRPNEIMHRFAGMTSDKKKFFVQIKEDKRTDKKVLLSVFPER